MSLSVRLFKSQNDITSKLKHYRTNLASAELGLFVCLFFVFGFEFFKIHCEGKFMRIRIIIAFACRAEAKIYN